MRAFDKFLQKLSLVSRSCIPMNHAVNCDINTLKQISLASNPKELQS